jgi:hypothetical protein
MSKFVQIIDYRTSVPDEIIALQEEWLEATQGKRTAIASLTCLDREDGHYVSLVEFPSYEEAMANSNLPETREFAGRLAALCDAPPVFHDLDVVYREPIGATAAEVSPEMRVAADCREMPSEIGCTLMISGRMDEVLDAAVAHAVAVHGHTDTPELREQVRGSLMTEQPAWL